MRGSRTIARAFFLLILLTGLYFGQHSQAWAQQTASVAAQAPSAAPAAVATRYADAIAQARGAALEILGRSVPGLAVAMGVNNGEIVWAEGFGYADLENRVPVWPTTRFRIGSVSKPLTAAALAQLVAPAPGARSPA